LLIILFRDFSVACYLVFLILSSGIRARIKDDNYREI